MNTISYEWLRTKTLDTEQKATEQWSSKWFILLIRCRNLELLCTVLLDSSTKESVRPYLPSFRKIILEKIKGELAFFFIYDRLHLFEHFWNNFGFMKGSRVAAVVKALVSHQCGPGLIPAWCICGLSLLLVLALLRGFISGSSSFPPSRKTITS